MTDFPLKQEQAEKNEQYSYRESYFMNFYPGRTDIVFAGDSITQRFEWNDVFPGKVVCNRGIGSDTSEGLLVRMDSIEKLRPRILFLMIGINDLAQMVSTEQIMQNYNAILSYVTENLPGTKIYVQSVLPVSQSLSEAYEDENARVATLNSRLKSVCEEQGIPYIDLFVLMADERGALRNEYTTDGVHLTVQGYALWLDAIQNLLLRDFC